jgi:uncharacterized membrane protein (UPF0136 family)
MEDFYLTIPHGLIVLAGGIAGYVKRRSTASLAAGVGFGGLLLAFSRLNVVFSSFCLVDLNLTLEIKICCQWFCQLFANF